MPRACCPTACRSVSATSLGRTEVAKDVFVGAEGIIEDIVRV